MNPSINKRSTGQQGEDLAAAFLVRAGYRILVRNYRCRYAEVDIIARKRDLICFVEVKVRKNDVRGSAWESVPVRKQQRIVLAAQAFLAESRYDRCQPRFDVMAVTPTSTDAWQVEHLPDAFRCDAPLG